MPHEQNEDSEDIKRQLEDINQKIKEILHEETKDSEEIKEQNERRDTTSQILATIK